MTQMIKFYGSLLSKFDKLKKFVQQLMPIFGSNTHAKKNSLLYFETIMNQCSLTLFQFVSMWP